jgi:predicted metal-dependent peptidase
MVDTSGSISDEMVAESYSEIKGAIDALDGRINGWLGFFDYDAYPAVPFDTVDELKKIKPKGGGGTSFFVIFDYLKQFAQDKEVSCLIILTDGLADFPPEKVAMDIPVLWIINNETETPPWGKVVRIESESN